MLPYDDRILPLACMSLMVFMYYEGTVSHFIFCKLTSETGPPKAGQRYIFRISRREVLLEASAESQEVCSIDVMKIGRAHV